MTNLSDTPIDELTHDQRQELISKKKNLGMVLLVVGLIFLVALTGGLWNIIGAGAIGVGIAASLLGFIPAAMQFKQVGAIQEIDVLSQSLHQNTNTPTTDDEILAAAEAQ
tara:strand:+ start:113 stop:442 length:330 start_codon:yes stop_codon:yes gene_type:complete